MGYLETSPPPDQRERAIKIQHVDQAAFQQWLDTLHPFQTLPATEASVRYLIPPKLWDYVTEPAKVRVHLMQADFLEFFITETMAEPLTDLRALWQHQQAIDRQSSSAAGVQAAPLVLPPNIDIFHLNWADYLFSGELKPTDKIYLSISLESLGAELNVISYGDRPELRNQGVATSFYQRLREIARALGFKYLTGTNPLENQAYFKNKLGRISFEDLSSELQAYFLSHHSYEQLFEEPGDDFTVDFLDSAQKDEQNHE